MAQGTRVTGNLFYDNSTDDLFVEVNHGPFLVDNNLLLSSISLQDWSEGGAYAHNLMTGRIVSRPELTRSTPYHQAHSTALAGLSSIQGGDSRFYNNIVVGGTELAASVSPGVAPAQPFDGFGLWVYDTRKLPLQTGGNVYYRGARPYFRERSPLALQELDPKPAIAEEGNRVYLSLSFGPELLKAATVPVTTELLGRARIPKLPYENADGSALVLDSDYAGKPRSDTHPSAGPFEKPGQGSLSIKVW
jgi:hypothetical protein